MQKLNQDMS